MLIMHSYLRLGFIRTYLFAVGCITAFLGVSLLLCPTQMAHIFFFNVSESTDFFVRITGSTLIGYSTLNILASRHKEKSLQNIATWGNLMTLSIASLITIAYYSKLDSNGWLIVMQHIVFGVGFAICAIKIKLSNKPT